MIAFLTHCTSQGHADSTARKYRNTLTHLTAYCKQAGIDAVRELTTDTMDAFRASRAIKAITSAKELELLRQFVPSVLIASGPTKTWRAKFAPLAT